MTMFILDNAFGRVRSCTSAGRQTLALLQAKMPEPQLDATPRFGPAAKAARAKEREQEQAKLKAQQKVDITARRWDFRIKPIQHCAA